MEWNGLNSCRHEAPPADTFRRAIGRRKWQWELLQEQRKFHAASVGFPIGRIHVCGAHA
jgi:hypothetical protein